MLNLDYKFKCLALLSTLQNDDFTAEYSATSTIFNNTALCSKT